MFVKVKVDVKYEKVISLFTSTETSLNNLRSLATDPTTLTPNEDGGYPETSFMASYTSLARLTKLIGDAACSNSFA